MREKKNSLYRTVLMRMLAVFFALPFIFSGHTAQAAKASHWITFKGSSDRSGVSESSSVKLPLEVIWTYTPEGKTNGFVDWGPVAANGVVYTGDGLNRIVALDAKSGNVVWKKDLISNIFSVTLSEDAKILYATTAITTKPTATLYALDPVTGEVLWDNMVDGQPAVGGMEGAPAVKNGRIYVGYLQYEGKGGVAVYDGLNGKLLWHAEVKKFSPYSPITYGEGKVFVGFENKTINCLDAETGRHLWEQKVDELPYGAPLVFDKKVYTAAGSYLYALDVRTGQIMWQKSIEGHVGHGSLSIHNKTLYVGTTESQMLAFKASDGNLVWANDLKKGSIESSAIIDVKKKMLYIGTQENWLLALSLKNGEVKQAKKLSEDARGVWKSAPALYEGRLYVGSLDRNFYALQ